MRGDIIYQVFGVHEDRDKDIYFGVFRTPEEAAAEIQRLKLKEEPVGVNWAQNYHNKGFVIRSKIVDTDFQIPSLPKPRDKYCVSCTSKPNRPGSWNSTRVEVFRRGQTISENQRIGDYVRNYAMLQTFEPFRQGEREFALISRDYTRTAVLDLTSGEIIAEEPRDAAPGTGFCPVGFFVPDWWDVNDGSTLLGSEYWSADDEWPVGDFGFVWGCVWGDDSSWKVQYLDLSHVRNGVITRDERFGYVELATSGFTTPCLAKDLDRSKPSAPPPFIYIERFEGVTRVRFEIEMTFDLQSGKSTEWQRLKISNME